MIYQYLSWTCVLYILHSKGVTIMLWTFSSTLYALTSIVKAFNCQIACIYATVPVSIRSTYEHQFQRRKLHCHWPARVEQSSSSTATRHELFAVQAATENISVRELVNQVIKALCDSCFLRLRNYLNPCFFVYLFTYCLWSSRYRHVFVQKSFRNDNGWRRLTSLKPRTAWLTLIDADE